MSWICCFNICASCWKLLLLIQHYLEMNSLKMYALLSLSSFTCWEKGRIIIMLLYFTNNENQM